MFPKIVGKEWLSIQIWTILVWISEAAHELRRIFPLTLKVIL